ncbi:MAG: hypothetical protein M3O25_04065 [Actinomycetota bacterium]|nr:hypothetical protein [Actinomycetota bacterium]
MAEPETEPRERDEWRGEVELDLDDDDDGHTSFGERLHGLDLDDDARGRLGGSVIVTRDGPHIFLYAWHEESAREAERVVRELMQEDGLAGEVELRRWHPGEEAWKPAAEPLPRSDDEREAEEDRLERERIASGEHPWEVVIDMPDLRSTRELTDELVKRGLPIKRRFRYLLVGAPTEEAAVEIGEGLEGDVPEGAHVGIRATPEGLTTPAFVLLQGLKPGVIRDLGL